MVGHGEMMTPQPDQEIIAAAREIMDKRYVPVLELLPEKYDGAKYPNRREHQDG